MNNSIKNSKKNINIESNQNQSKETNTKIKENSKNTKDIQTKKDIQVKKEQKAKNSKKLHQPRIPSTPKLIILSTTIILFIILTIFVLIDKTGTIDNFAMNIATDIRNDRLNNFMIILTNISSSYSLIAISCFLLFVMRQKKKPFLITLNLTAVFIISQIVKFIIQRPRPVDINLVDYVGYSYPSGHSMVSLAYFGFIAYLIFKNTQNKFLKYFFSSLMILLIISIGFSRIYLGVHYLSDVLGGFLLGISYLIIFIDLQNKSTFRGRK